MPQCYKLLQHLELLVLYETYLLKNKTFNGASLSFLTRFLGVSPIIPLSYN